MHMAFVVESVEEKCVWLVSDLLKRVLKQCLSGHRDLYMAGQGIGLDRDNIKNEIHHCYKITPYVEK